MRPVSMVDIRDPSFRTELEEWVTTGTCPPSWTGGAEPTSAAGVTPEEEQADACLQQAVSYIDQGKPQDALRALKEGVALDPENWLIRKQGWALEAPEAFYSGDVDYEWQKTRIKTEIDQSEIDQSEEE